MCLEVGRVRVDEARDRLQTKTKHYLPRNQARSSVFESDWDFGSALGIMEKAKRKTRERFTAQIQKSDRNRTKSVKNKH